MTDKTTTPARRRALITAQTAKVPTRTVTELAARAYTENAAQNKAKSAYEKTRTSLFKQMNEEGITNFDTTVQIDGKPVTVNAAITTPSVNYIDVQVLAKHVSLEVLLKIVTASQKAVIDEAGASVAATATRTGRGTTNVSVKVVK